MTAPKPQSFDDLQTQYAAAFAQLSNAETRCAIDGSDTNAERDRRKAAADVAQLAAAISTELQSQERIKKAREQQQRAAAAEHSAEQLKSLSVAIPASIEADAPILERGVEHLLGLAEVARQLERSQAERRAKLRAVPAGDRRTKHLRDMVESASARLRPECLLRDALLALDETTWFRHFIKVTVPPGPPTLHSLKQDIGEQRAAEYLASRPETAEQACAQAAESVKALLTELAGPEPERSAPSYEPKARGHEPTSADVLVANDRPEREKKNRRRAAGAATRIKRDRDGKIVAASEELAS